MLRRVDKHFTPTQKNGSKLAYSNRILTPLSYDYRLTANIWILKVQTTLLGFQKHLEVYSPCLRLMIDKSRWDASREVGFIAAKAKIQEQCLWVVVPQVEFVLHTANTSQSSITHMAPFGCVRACNVESNLSDPE